MVRPVYSILQFILCLNITYRKWFSSLNRNCLKPNGKDNMFIFENINICYFNLCNMQFQWTVRKCWIQNCIWCACEKLLFERSVHIFKHINQGRQCYLSVTYRHNMSNVYTMLCMENSFLIFITSDRDGSSALSLLMENENWETEKSADKDHKNKKIMLNFDYGFVVYSCSMNIYFRIFHVSCNMHS